MKKTFLLLSLAVFMLTAMAVCGTGNFSYYGSITVYNGETLGGVCLKSNGDLAYVTFNDANSHFVYVTNAVSGAKDTTYIPSLVTTVAMASGRGLNDVKVDGNGNIYISGCGSAASDSQLLKFNSSLQCVWSMSTMASTSQYRHNGVEVLSNSVIAITRAWNFITFLNAMDASSTSEVSGGVNYDRQLVFDPVNNNIFVSKNGSYNAYALKVFAGGSPTNLTGYSLATDNHEFFYGSFSTQYGGSNQPIGIDTINNRLLMYNNFDTSVRVCNISGSGATVSFSQLTTIKGNPASALTFFGCNGISFNKMANNEEFIAIGAAYTDGSVNTQVIDLYRDESTVVKDWSIY
jgi:hypothetical protein